MELPNDLRFCCRGVRRSGAIRQKNIAGAAAPRVRPGQQQALVKPYAAPKAPGGIATNCGRTRAAGQDATLVADLEALVEPTMSGDPDSPLRWTSKSVRHLAGELQALGHEVSHRLVAQLLHESGFSLQANRKTREGPQHPDGDAQFRYINEQVRRFQKRHHPAISVDTKKKELVGDFKNPGRAGRPHGHPDPVRVHDFLIPARGKAIPYGVYDLTRNEGWVSVGIDHATASFAPQGGRRPRRPNGSH